MISRLLLVFALLFTVTKVTDGISSTACYGTGDCDYYSMNCAPGEIIRLYNLYAGYKNTTIYPECGTANHCNSSSICCDYNSANDVIELFNMENTYRTYMNCSGKTNCDRVHAPWQQMTNSALTTSYVKVEYDCDTASEKVPFCGGPTGTVTQINRDVQIMFDGSAEKFDPLKASKECKCDVTNLGDQQDVVFTALDVRLQTYYKSENQTHASCSSALFQSPIFGAQCQESDRHYEDNFYVNRYLTLLMTAQQTVEMTLKDIHANGTQDSPAMVWISLRADVNNGVRVTCKEVTSADFTTTTTTTPTTTTTTTTTTTPKPTTTTTSTTSTSTTTTTTTTTTPKPTTTTTTTPKPTTTTTTTTPKPTTTTTTTTPKPTTTSTTPKPTTTSTTPKPTTTSTTPKPTTTSTTPRPTTSTTTTTSKPTTTSTTSTSTTSKTTTTTKAATIPTPAPTSKPQPTPEPTTRAPKTTEASDRITGDGENDQKQRTAVYLAICIPVIACLFIITAFLLWLYWKRTAPRRKKFHFMKDTPRSVVYDTFSNPQILDEYIKVNGNKPNSLSGSEKRPISTFISVPNPHKRPRSILSNGSVYKQDPVPPVQPYKIPINATTGEPLYATPNKKPVPNVVHVRLNQDERDNPVERPNTFDQSLDTELAKLNDVYDPESENDVPEQQHEETVQSQNKPKRRPNDNDGSVVIHVDNLNLPPVSARSTNANTSANTSSTRSEIGSTPGNITPERRNSEPALITTDPILDRHSASAYVLPGSSPEDSSVLFVK